MLNRRRFLKEATLTTGAVLSSAMLPAFSQQKQHKLTILHTNDVHSRLEPFPMDGGKYQGLGGVAARAALINKIRSEEENVLLLDAGDMFQGTPFFNIYKGEPEIKAMTMMGYDAGTIGNHDFDAGLDNLALQLKHASFPILVANYDFSNTPMANKSKPFTVFNKGGIKVGVFGIGIELKGLVPQNLYGNTVYLDPIKRANEVANELKKREACDMVICLSHLGFTYNNNTVSDEVLARQTENIDLIIGGHTHTFLEEPRSYENIRNKAVMINQVGFAGINLGRLDYTFFGDKTNFIAKANTVVVSEKTNI
jgi:5'-nucleotidase